MARQTRERRETEALFYDALWASYYNDRKVTFEILSEVAVFAENEENFNAYKEKGEEEDDGFFHY